MRARLGLFNQLARALGLAQMPTGERENNRCIWPQVQDAAARDFRLPRGIVHIERFNEMRARSSKRALVTADLSEQQVGKGDVVTNDRGPCFCEVGLCSLSRRADLAARKTGKKLRLISAKARGRVTDIAG